MLKTIRRQEEAVHFARAFGANAKHNLVWAGPDYLPTLDELRNHSAWIARVEQLPAPADDSALTRSLDTAPLPEDSL